MSKYIEISIISTMLILFGFSLYVIESDKEGKKIESIEINILDGDTLGFVTKDIVMNLLDSDSVKSWCELSKNIELDSLEQSIYQLPYVDSVEVYSTLDKKITIDVKQSDILFRIISDNGESYYVDNDCNFTKVVSYFTIDTHIVTCSEKFLHFINKNGEKNEKNYNNLKNLLNFVKIVKNDSFWNSMIVQITINDNNELELIPRVGLHKVVLCRLDKADEYDHYLNKLRVMYQSIAKSKDWGKYEKIDTRYKDIVVTTLTNKADN